MERMSRLITANEVKQKQQEHNSLMHVNEDLVEQVTHELMSNDEFVKKCDAVIDKSITKQVEQAVADDNNDTDYFYISMDDLADRGEFWLAKELNKQMTKHWHIKLAEMGYKVQ